MKNILLFFFSLTFLGIGCKKRIDGPVVIETTADMTLVNEKGDNLIESPDFNREGLKIYYIINEKKELYQKGNLTYPKGYTIVKNQDNEELLRVFLNSDGNLPITLIEFSKDDTDTIKSEFIKNGNSIHCSKIWYNNQLKWQINNGQHPELRTFSIIKKF